MRQPIVVVVGILFVLAVGCTAPPPEPEPEPAGDDRV